MYIRGFFLFCAVPSSFFPGAFLCGFGMSSPCLCDFSLGTLVSGRHICDFKLALGVSMDKLADAMCW